MLRMLSCLVAVLLAPVPGPAAPAPRVSAEPQVGEVFLWDSTSTATRLASADTSLRMPVLGVSAEAEPWRWLLVEGDFLAGTGATLDTPQVNPTRTGVGYWRMGLGLGTRLRLDGLGPLRALVGTVGYGHERWSADHQFMPGASRRQVTPSFSRDEPWLRVGAEGALLDDRLALRASVTGVPWAHVAEQWATDGSGQWAWGLDFAARAEYGLGPVLGALGELGVGLGVDGGFRRIRWSGTGTRTNGQNERVQDVSEAFSHLDVVVFVAWRLAVPEAATPAPSEAPPAAVNAAKPADSATPPVEQPEAPPAAVDAAKPADSATPPVEQPGAPPAEAPKPPPVPSTPEQPDHGPG